MGDRLKLYMNPRELEVIEKAALLNGETQEQFDKWVSDYVVVIEPLY